jgi:hypothetical protein
MVQVHVNMNALTEWGSNRPSCGRAMIFLPRSQVDDGNILDACRCCESARGADNARTRIALAACALVAATPLEFDAANHSVRATVARSPRSPLDRRPYPGRPRGSLPCEALALCTRIRPAILRQVLTPHIGDLGFHASCHCPPSPAPARTLATSASSPCLLTSPAFGTIVHANALIGKHVPYCTLSQSRFPTRAIFRSLKEKHTARAPARYAALIPKRRSRRPKNPHTLRHHH